MFMQALHSEFLKIRYTKSFITLLSLITIFSLGSSAVIGYMARKGVGEGIIGETIIWASMTSFGTTSIIPLSLLIFFFVSALTSEYATGTRMYTHLTTPNRTIAAIAKWVAVSAVGIVFVLLLSYLNQLILTVVQIGNINVSPDKGSLLVHPLGLALAVPFLVAFIHGLGYVFRSTAGVIVIMMIMLMRIDNMIILFPKVQQAFDYLFMRNVRTLWNANFISQDFFTSLGITSVWSIVMFAIGIVVLNKRDT